MKPLLSYNLINSIKHSDPVTSFLNEKLISFSPPFAKQSTWNADNGNTCENKLC